MTRTSRSFPVALCLPAAAALAACGGGRGTPAVLPAQAAAEATARPAIAHGTLTIRFPAAFRQASGVVAAGAPAPRHLPAAIAARRRPAYVNPTSGNTIDIYVDGNYVDDLDGDTDGDSLTVQPTSDGTQTITVPIYQASCDISLVEHDWNYDVVALGETSVSVTPGQTLALSVTMLMNATGFAVGPNADGSDAVEMNGTGSYPAVGAAGVTTPVYIYPTDPSGGFVGPVPATGVGGLPASLTATGTASDASRLSLTLLGAYAVSFQTGTSVLPVTATANSPAAVAVTDSAHYPWLSKNLDGIGYPGPATATGSIKLVPTGYPTPRPPPCDGDC